MYKLTVYYYNNEDMTGIKFVKSKKQAELLKDKFLRLNHITKVIIEKVK